MNDDKGGVKDTAKETPKDTKQETTSNSSTPDTVKMAEEIGRLKKENEEWHNKWSTAEPVLQAVYGDNDARTATEKAYQKMRGVNVDEKKDDVKEDKTNKAEEKTQVPPPPSPTEIDNRNALLTRSVTDFEKEHGIDKLKEEDKKTLNTAILTELKGILDPMDTGRDVRQLMSSVSATKISGLLEKAYFLATRQEREKEIAEKAVNEYSQGTRGMIGSIPADGSLPSDDVVLSEKERNIARKMHISEEDYLKNKREIAKNGGSIV